MSIGINEILNYSSELTMLYVEDDDGVREHTLEILEDFFREVLVARDGQEGLEKYLSYKKTQDSFPDLVITDIRMPRLDGIEMSREILRIHDEQTVIVISAHNDSDKLIELIEIGIYAFLHKPIRPEQIYKTLYKTSKTIQIKKENSILQQQLQKSRTELESANYAKEQLLIDIAHHTKSTLNSIVSLKSSLDRLVVERKTKEYLDAIDNSAKNLLELMNIVQNYSLIEAGEMKIETLHFNLNTLFEHIFAVVSRKTKAKGLKLLFDIDKRVPAMIQGDPLHMSQVVFNLLNNAVRFTRTGTITLKIEMHTTLQKQQFLKFDIIDTGIGFAAERLNRLIDSFQFSTQYLDNQQSIKGLRLGVTNELIKLMGGSLDVQSVQGEGSRFTFTVDIASLMDKSHLLLIKETMLKKVLIIDDDTELLANISDIMKFYQFKSYFASTVHEMRLLMDDIHFDIVLADKKFLIQCDREKLEMHPYTKMILLESGTIINKKQIYNGMYIHTTIKKPLNQRSLYETIFELYGDEEGSKLDKEDILTLKGSRILLVAKNDLHQTVIAGLLLDTSIDMLVANTLDSAADYMQRFHDIELIYVSIEWSGELVSLVHRIGKYHTTPIVAIDSDGKKSELDSYHQEYIDALLTTPIERSRFYTYLLQYITPKISAYEVEQMRKDKLLTPANQTLSTVLDTQRGLTYAAGNSELYANILKDFTHKHLDTYKKLQLFVAHEEYIKAEQVIYNVKKLSMHIGALALVEILIELERLLKKDQHKFLQHLDQYQKRFLLLAKEIEVYLKETRRTSNSHTMLADSRLFDLLSEIYTQAKKHRALVCKDLASELESYEWPPEHKEQLESIATALKKYRFKDAIAIIEEIV